MNSLLLTIKYERKLLLLVQSVFYSYLLSPFDSETGINLSLDKPWGNNKVPFVNFFRTAVLRNYFGKTLEQSLEKNPTQTSRFTYGSGSGSGTVGTLPGYFSTRDLTEEMKEICYLVWKFLTSKKSLQCGDLSECFNHITLLTYFIPPKVECNLYNGKVKSSLGYHADSVYSASGKFQIKKNSQKENTPTVIINLCDDRELNFQERFVTDGKYGKVWDKVKKKCEQSFILKHKTMFILHPDDEKVMNRKTDISSQYMHGVDMKKQHEGVLSLGLAMRCVTSVNEYDKKGYIPSSNITSSEDLNVMNSFLDKSDDLKLSFNEFVSKKIKHYNIQD